MSDGSTFRTQWRVSPIGGLNLSGGQVIDHNITTVTLLGGVSGDLSDATITSGVTLTKFSLVGGVSLRVPPGTRVEAGGFTLLGGQSVNVQSAAGGPVLKIRNYGLVGGIDVRSR